MTDLSQYRFFISQPSPCGYLREQQASNLLFDPRETVDAELFMQLCEYGFRRSGGQFYRPRCQSCNACIPVRVLANEFVPNRQQKRNLKRNADLTLHITKPRFTEEYYDLYARYIEGKHADGDMYPASPEQFSRFLLNPLPFSRFYEFRKEERLLAVAVTDELPRGLTAVYTFYDPDEGERSLGRFAILSQINQCKHLGLPALYLGYAIRQCRKMNYKTEYRPIQMMMYSNHWYRYSEKALAD